MKQSIGLTSLVVRDYDEALAFYVGTLGFTLVEDSIVAEQGKRWVVVAPPGATEARLLLARAANPEQAAHVGNQTGGRVFLFLTTDDFERDSSFELVMTCPLTPAETKLSAKKLRIAALSTLAPKDRS